MKGVKQGSVVQMGQTSLKGIRLGCLGLIVGLKGVTLECLGHRVE